MPISSDRGVVPSGPGQGAGAPSRGRGRGGRLRVLLAVEYFRPHVGGVETLFENLARGLTRRGFDVTVVTIRVPGSRARETWEGIRIVRVSTPGILHRYLFILMAIPSIWRSAREADVIHAGTYNASIPASLVGRILGKPVILTVHEVFAEQWTSMAEMNPILGFGHRVFERLIPKLWFSRYIADSHFTRKRLLAESRIDPDKVTTIYPAIDYGYWTADRHTRRDLKRELALGAGSFIYLFFGRPGVSKGLEYLIEAAALVRAEVPDSRLVLLLSHHPSDQYRKRVEQIRTLRLESHITIMDPVKSEDLPGTLLGADLIVVPSLSEGFGYAALEAATLGCPVVATAGHSVEEIVGDVVTIVPPRDARALAGAIVTEARHRRVPAAPARFTTDDHVEKTVAIYEEVLA